MERKKKEVEIVEIAYLFLWGIFPIYRVRFPNLRFYFRNNICFFLLRIILLCNKINFSLLRIILLRIIFIYTHWQSPPPPPPPPPPSQKKKKLIFSFFPKSTLEVYKKGNPKKPSTHLYPNQVKNPPKHLNYQYYST